ncbi:GNAT family N-acetyltransferase [Barrientosiimonas marina]|uniref:Enhanced intracellular survival protein Eis n=1 Tax=Lentibacillus kimchii TaxID=1542911 RepID=A0ABW2UUN4_9BACI
MTTIKRLDPEDDAHAIFALSQFAFQYELSEQEFNERKADASRHIIWGMMDHDQIAAKVHLVPLSCYINGKSFEMGGVSSVATWPEYRRQGAVKQLLQTALQYMRANGQTLSLLHPFSFGFYRKYGWEYAFSQKTYRISIARLKQSWDVDGYVRRLHNDIPVLDQIYTTYAQHYNGMLVRDNKWWKERVLKNNQQQAAAYDAHGQPQGYILYSVKEGQLMVHELIAETVDAYKQLLRFIANHDSMAETVTMTVPENDPLPLLVDEPRFEQTINPYFMARIVDVHAFLKQYPFLNEGAESVALHVTDAFLPENNGTYQLSQTGSGPNVTHLRTESSREASGVHCNVQQLTVMLMSFKRPLELYRAGLIAGDRRAVECLESMIPDQQTYLPDFF